MLIYLVRRCKSEIFLLIYVLYAPYTEYEAFKDISDAVQIGKAILAMLQYLLISSNRPKFVIFMCIYVTIQIYNDIDITLGQGNKPIYDLAMNNIVI